MFDFQPAQADISLADAVAEVYPANYRILTALAQEYGFEYSFYIQPHPAVGEKRLTKEEQDLGSKIDPALARLAKAAYANIASAAPDHRSLWFSADVFDQETTQIWIDQWGYVAPEGNRLVAQEILAGIKRQMSEEQCP